MFSDVVGPHTHSSDHAKNGASSSSSSSQQMKICFDLAGNATNIVQLKFKKIENGLRAPFYTILFSILPNLYYLVTNKRKKLKIDFKNYTKQKIIRIIFVEALGSV